MSAPEMTREEAAAALQRWLDGARTDLSMLDAVRAAVAYLREPAPGAEAMREASYCTFCGRETPHAPVPDPNPPISTATSIPACEAPARPHCELCGELMPPGEEMFKYHGASGPCPIVPLPAPEVPEAWTATKDAMPEKSRGLLAFCQGFKEHSGVSWRRTGFAFMAWHPPEWSEQHMKDARKRLDADSLEVTHWMYLTEPKETV